MNESGQREKGERRESREGECSSRVKHESCKEGE